MLFFSFLSCYKTLWQKWLLRMLLNRLLLAYQRVNWLMPLTLLSWVVRGRVDKAFPLAVSSRMLCSFGSKFSELLNILSDTYPTDFDHMSIWILIVIRMPKSRFFSRNSKIQLFNLRSYQACSRHTLMFVPTCCLTPTNADIAQLEIVGKI